MSLLGEEHVIVNFIIPNNKSSNNECMDDMKRAFEVCVDHSLNAKWVPEAECLKLFPVKNELFVFEEFTGSCFDYLSSSNCIILGPRCILDCLAADITMPKFQHPVFTVAMRDLVVTTSGFTEPQKSAIGKKIKFMGGSYTVEYRQSVTHLVINRAGSAKYERALEHGIPVMSEQWVNAVWEESTKRNVHARDEEFNKYKCSVFHNLVITCSQIPRKEKEQLKLHISNNGGEFCGELEANRTNVLVIAKPYGDKFLYATSWKIPCVIPAWVYDSIEVGHALPSNKYAIASFGQRCSTPEHGNTTHLPDISASFIRVPGNVDETICTSTTVTSRTPIVASKAPTAPSKTPSANNAVTSIKPLESPNKNKHMQLINKISASDVKKAGIFLDGCNIYFSGFNLEYTEMLRRIINSGGATRFNEISESVTHVIVGDFVQSDIKILKSQGSRLHVVTVEWLIESIRLGSAAPEDQFSCLDDLPSPIEFQSPLSKKGFLVLHTQNNQSVSTHDMKSKRSCSPRKRLMPKKLFEQYSYFDKSSDETRMDDKHSNDYSQNDQDGTMRNNDDSVTKIDLPHKDVQSAEGTELFECSSTTKTKTTFFNGITFSLAGYSSVTTADIEKLIRSVGGKVVPRRFKGIPDYGVVPLHGTSLLHTTTEIVTRIWLDDCLGEGTIVPVEYYHQPVNYAEDAKPLSQCIVSTTSYSGSELRFIVELVEGLGAVHQSMMARVNRSADNLLATTHLICPDHTNLASSRKYKAACKWGIPSLSHKWLLACAKTNTKVSEEAFLVSSFSIDSPEVIARTPVLAIKRKYCLGEAASELEQVSPMSAPLSVVSQPSDAVQFPSTPSHMTSHTVSTPVLNSARHSTSYLKTPENVSFTFPRAPDDIPTPDTPYGECFKENPSPRTRKMWKKWIDQWPAESVFKTPPPSTRERRNSTPMAELFRRGWQKFAIEPYMRIFHRQDNPESENRIDIVDPEPHSSQDNMLGCEPLLDKNNSSHKSVPSQGAGINNQLQEVNQILDSASKSSGKIGKDCESDNHSTPRAPAVRNVSHAPKRLDLCTDLVEWIDPVISNQQKPTPVFMLSSMENREQCEEIIRSLGGIVSSSQIFEPNTTHLVCQQLSRNEKILSCIAAGKWILEKRYLEDSQKQGHFLDEEEYEWGNPRAAYLQSYYKTNSFTEHLAKATYRWRCKVLASGKGAFTGMKAIVCAPKDKSDLYKRLIIAGGGEIVDVSPPFNEPNGATVCIIDLAKVQLRVDLQALVDKKVPCVPPIYLNNFLVDYPLPDVVDCLIPEYKALL